MRQCILLILLGGFCLFAPPALCAADNTAPDIGAVPPPDTAPAPPPYDGKPGVKAGQQCINPKDGAVMVWVPAGEFLMGNTDADQQASSTPQHTVFLDGYWAYQCEVTVAQYKAYCAAMEEDMPKDTPAWGWRDTHPMVNVNWMEARAYARWAGAKLPTEAQWEKAARGTDGRTYPWGNAWDADKCNNAVSGLLKPVPVGSFPDGASPYGCLHMAGNVWEWCEDWYAEDYYKNSPTRNPTGPEDGKGRVLRGGAWNVKNPLSLRCAGRTYTHPAKGLNDFGFRCVVSPVTPDDEINVTRSVEETLQTEQDISGRMVGIGVKLSKHVDGIMIAQVLPGQPAERSGIRSGEVILSIAGRPAQNMPLPEAIEAITGDEGTQITLEVRNTAGDVRKVQITREIIKLSGVVAKLIDEQTGYLEISTFNQETPLAVHDALTITLSPRNVSGIILDLRGNTGGIYPEVLKVARMLIDGNPPKILWIVRQNGKDPTPVQVQTLALSTLPCVVLIDGKTSGAAELLAAALGQSARATLVGSRTAGGAILKEIVANADGSSREVLVGNFWFPKTGKTGTDGVIPDVVAPIGATSEQVLELGKKTLAEMIAE